MENIGKVVNERNNFCINVNSGDVIIPSTSQEFRLLQKIFNSVGYSFPEDLSEEYKEKIGKKNYCSAIYIKSKEIMDLWVRIHNDLKEKDYQHYQQHSCSFTQFLKNNGLYEEKPENLE